LSTLLTFGFNSQQAKPGRAAGFLFGAGPACENRAIRIEAPFHFVCCAKVTVAYNCLALLVAPATDKFLPDCLLKEPAKLVT
jgi:hypothetical protein